MYQSYLFLLTAELEYTIFHKAGLLCHDLITDSKINISSTLHILQFFVNHVTRVIRIVISAISSLELKDCSVNSIRTSYQLIPEVWALA